MTDRTELANAFLAGTEWAAATRAPLAGDASNRRYERLSLGGRTAVLMDAPPDKDEDVRPFVHIARFLSDIGLSAPTILAEDDVNGFLVLEDLGDDLYARVVEREPKQERVLYEAATDALLHLHRADPPAVAHYHDRLMTEMAALAFTRYQEGITGEVDRDALDRFMPRFEDLLAASIHGAPVLVQRDYHAENLLWLPHRDGVRRVGLLDFQDAMLGHPAYDLVSLLQDARRDVSATTEMAMIDRYIAQSGCDDHGFRTAYAVLGAQRNMRILGVFARICIDLGKPRYIDMIPRVWDHMARDLDHPALAPVADLVLGSLPLPTASHLDALRVRCGSR
jgi:aminoglycoside/choline kinase family phosphotransferase